MPTSPPRTKIPKAKASLLDQPSGTMEIDNKTIVEDVEEDLDTAVIDVSAIDVEEIDVGAIDATVIDVEDEESESSKDSDANNRSDLVKYDPLQSYLREISRLPKLSETEERNIAFEYYQTQSKAAAYALITNNLILVVKIARDYSSAAKNLLDLIQEGNLGLMEAVKNFDPYKEVRFPSYAVWWIKAYIIRYLIANWRVVKIGTTQAQRKLFFNLKKEKEKLEREGFFPTPKLLAERLQVKEQEVLEMDQRLGSPDVSVDAPVSSDPESPTLLGMLPDSAVAMDQAFWLKERSTLLQNSLKEFLDTLSDKERAIFAGRVLSEDKLTLQDLSDKFLISKERIRQIENRLKERLRQFMINNLGEDLVEEFTSNDE